MHNFEFFVERSSKKVSNLKCSCVPAVEPQGLFILNHLLEEVFLSSFYLFCSNKYLLRACCVPGSIQGIGDKSLGTRLTPCPHKV